jgi:hypothetical protein
VGLAAAKIDSGFQVPHPVRIHNKKGSHLAALNLLIIKKATVGTGE